MERQVQAEPPKAAIETLTTRDGTRLAVRTVLPQDEPILAALFEHVTPVDLRFRFFSSMRHIDHGRLKDMLDVDMHGTITFLGFDETGTPVATAMFVGDPDRVEGEAAVTVRSDRKGHGIGWTMLDHVVAHARTEGFQRVRSLESRDNAEALAVEHDAGFTLHSYEEDATQTVATIDVASARF